MDDSSPAGSRDWGPVDRTLLGVYLNDHLAGSTAGARRMRRTAEELRQTPVGPDIARVAAEVAEEREVLRALVRRLDLPMARHKQVMTGIAEALGRLKLNGRFARHSPMTPLLEVEVLRAAVVGKLGLWQTLADIAPALELDEERFERLREQTEAQVGLLDRAHEYVRDRALRAGS